MSTSTIRTSLVLLTATLLWLLTGCTPALSPTVRDPGAVTVEGVLGAPVLLATGESTVYARIRVATLSRPEQERGPVNIGLAIDTSGSMEGAAIEEAKKSALQMIDALKDGDRLSIVIFHTKAETLLPSTELSPEVRAKAREMVLQVKAEGTTEMAGGLNQALSEVRANFNQKGINRVVLLGDGIPNHPAGMEDTARSAAGTGVTITTVGLGLDYDEILMGKIADLSGGRYKYIESADKVVAFFKDELQRLDTVYGRQASVTLTPGPGVKIESVVGTTNPAYTSGTGSAHVTIGDIARGDSRDIMVRLTVKPRKAGVPIELIDAVMTFEDAIENAGHLERHVYLGAHTTEDEAKVVKARNADVDLSAALAEAAATTLQALELGKRGSYVRARDMLTKGASAALAQSKRTPSAELEKHASNMTAVAKDMPEADRPAPEPSEPQGYGYDFNDDALQSGGVGAEAEMPSPAVAKTRKEAHSHAMETIR